MGIFSDLAMNKKIRIVLGLTVSVVIMVVTLNIIHSLYIQKPMDDLNTDTLNTTEPMRNVTTNTLNTVEPIKNAVVSPMSNAQSSDNFKNYTNKEMGFSIQYPTNCEVEYENFEPNINLSVVYFNVPDEENCFRVSMEKVKPYLDNDTMTLKNTSIQQYAQKELNDLRSDKLNIIGQNWVTVGGNPGYKIEYTWSCAHCGLLDPAWGTPDSFSFQIFTIVNGNLYRLSYSDQPVYVPRTLPIANKMVESFQILR